MKENIRNLKHIAFGFLGLWLIINVYFGLLYHAIFKFAEFKTITFSGAVDYQSELIVGAILLWILAHIFEKGVEMKEEQALTI